MQSQSRGARGLVLALILLASAPLAAAEEAEATRAERLAYFASKFEIHEPMYFSVGWREETNARFQFSFRYNFLTLDGKGEAAPRTERGFLEGLRFGYTQMSIWDLESESAPFHDTNYRPSVFYLRENWGSLVSFQAGYEHESNGRDGEASRSLNVLFVRPEWRIADWGAHSLTLAPRAFVYVGDLSDNPDIADYRGYLDLSARLEAREGPTRGFEAALKLRKGTKEHYGSIQLDLSYPLHRAPVAFDAFLHLQYFSGWGESLLDYDRKLPSQIRLGFMLIR